MKLVYYYDSKIFDESFVKTAKSDVRKTFGKDTRVLFVPRQNEPNEVVVLYDDISLVSSNNTHDKIDEPELLNE